MMEINNVATFISKIPAFCEYTKQEQVDYLAYYSLMQKDSFMPKDIKEYFDALNLQAYSNIPAYLKKNSKGRNCKYVKKKEGYVLNKFTKDNMDKLFAVKKTHIPSNDLFPKDILIDTRTYLEKIANQAISCYDLELFDACSVMLRKLTETLIIEAFERHGIEKKIKNQNGDFFYLSDLITKLLTEKNWSIGRNAKKGFAAIKALGDLCAHNRRFCAREEDIAKIKDDIRICIEELVHLIDYPMWNKDKKTKK